MDQVKKHIIRATELTAISVSRLIKEQRFTPQDLLTEEESITGDDKWFDLKEVENGHKVNTLTVDKSGVKIVRQIHH